MNQLGTTPDDDIALVDNQGIKKAWARSELQDLAEGGVIIRIAPAGERRRPRDAIWRREWDACVDQGNRPELGALLPAPNELPGRQMDGDRNRRDVVFPILNGGSRNPKLIGRILLRVAQELAPYS